MVLVPHWKALSISKKCSRSLFEVLVFRVGLRFFLKPAHQTEGTYDSTDHF